MRKFSKVILIMAGVFASVGIGFSIGGVALGATGESVDMIKQIKQTKLRAVNGLFDWDWDYDDDYDEDYDEDYDDEEFDDDLDDDDLDDDNLDDDERGVTSARSSGRSFENVEELDIEVKYGELILEASDSDKVEIELDDGFGSGVEIKLESGHKLKIRDTKKIRGRTITVYYPEQTAFTKAELEIGAGTMEIADYLEADEVDITVGAGEFSNLDTIKAREFNIEVGVGSAEVMDLISDKIEGECGMGELDLTIIGKETDYNYKLECGVGEIQIGNSSYSGLGREKKISNTGASKKLELECGMGSIVVDFED